MLYNPSFIYLFSAIIHKHYVRRRRNLYMCFTYVAVSPCNCKRARISQMFHLVFFFHFRGIVKCVSDVIAELNEALWEMRMMHACRDFFWIRLVVVVVEKSRKKNQNNTHKSFIWCILLMQKNGFLWLKWLLRSREKLAIIFCYHEWEEFMSTEK